MSERTDRELRFWAGIRIGSTQHVTELLLGGSVQRPASPKTGRRRGRPRTRPQSRGRRPRFEVAPQPMTPDQVADLVRRAQLNGEAAEARGRTAASDTLVALWKARRRR